ncbi:MAG: hypothetical protein D6798_20170 [Deltaproteobacteria bacterium]|nr:MAG: hypothetical protein D6798_20170 [Deltaproteobacteria bacterium]
MIIPPLILVLATACGDKVGDDTGGGMGNVRTESLGSYTTDTGGLTGAIPLEVPDGTSSVAVHCGEYGYDTLGTAWRIVDPSGGDFYTNEYVEGHTDTPMRVGNHDDTLPILMPVSPDHDIRAGSWSVDVWIATGGRPTTVDCGAVYRVESPGSTATVDLNAVFVGLDSLGLDAASAPDDEDFQAALRYAEGLWSAAGVTIGEVRYFDFPGDVSRYQVIDVSDTDTSELGELFKTEVDGPARALTVFFVEEIASSSGATILGIAAGPPGVPTVAGTSKSGMAVTTVDLRADSREVGLILAHEGAHFMGLFHTTEKNASAFDPLTDTPECPASSDTDGNGLLDREECAGKGAENVMFWAPSVEASTTLTDDQGWVLRRNPVAR